MKKKLIISRPCDFDAMFRDFDAFRGKYQVELNWIEGNFICDKVRSLWANWPAEKEQLIAKYDKKKC